jgi:hypothetical protein
MFASVRIMAACAAAAVGFALAAAPAGAFTTSKNYHIMPTPAYMAKLAKAGTPPPAGPVNYYGGSVFTSSKVVSVMWGGSVNPTIVSTIPGFSGAIVNSTYVDQMSQYDTPKKGINGHKGTKQNIGRGTYLGQIVITPKNTSTSLEDSDIQKEIKYQIKKGVLPVADLNTLYMVYFPQNVSIDLDGLQSCQDFGAYHFAVNDVKLAKNNIFYAVEPDCGGSIANITFAASHEFAEATTDNVPTPGSVPDFPQAWNDASGFEIGDLCGGSGQLTAGATHWTVTQYFLNTTMKCSVGNYTSP